MRTYCSIQHKLFQLGNSVSHLELNCNHIQDFTLLVIDTHKWPDHSGIFLFDRLDEAL